MLKLKLQYFGHLIQRADTLGKILMLGKIEGRRRRDSRDGMVGWHRWLNGHEFEQTPRDSDGQGCWPAAVHGVEKRWTWLKSNNNSIHVVWWHYSGHWIFCYPHSNLFRRRNLPCSEKAMATHSSTLAWKIPRTEEPGRLQSMGSWRVGHDWATSLSLSCIGEGNGNPLQCSCLENPRDGRAWWAAIYGVAQRWTRLKQLSSSSNPPC